MLLGSTIGMAGKEIRDMAVDTGLLRYPVAKRARRLPK